MSVAALAGAAMAGAGLTALAAMTPAENSVRFSIWVPDLRQHSFADHTPSWH
jgi:hypothetical protein